jgi:D-tyrosyl-tRNA(Tyr) deacylase
MRAVLQRVSNAGVYIDDGFVASIEKGILILLGIETEDSVSDIDWLVSKISEMRIFSDDNAKMNLSVKNISGSFLVVSQFTLHASTRKGNRPSYIKAARPEQAIPLYDNFIEKLRSMSGLVVKTGIFGADMKVSLVNDGPVTIIIDSKQRE